MTTDELRTDAARRRALAQASACPKCQGAGGRYPTCYRCADSTEDHECPDWVPCGMCAGAKVLPDAAALTSAARDELLTDWVAWWQGRAFRESGWVDEGKDLALRFEALEAP